MYLYDWTDVHRRSCDEINAYETSAVAIIGRITKIGDCWSVRILCRGFIVNQFDSKDTANTWIP